MRRLSFCKHGYHAFTALLGGFAAWIDAGYPIEPRGAMENKMNTPLVTPWADPVAPTQSTLWRLMTDEGLKSIFVVKWTL